VPSNSPHEQGQKALACTFVSRASPGSPSHLTRRDTRRAGAGDTGDEADGRAATARYLRGRANTELGRFELAKEDLYAARALRPSHREVRLPFCVCSASC
jgi:hypothetical protein